MFNLKEFENNLIFEKVDKLNKYLSKNKVDKITKILDEFQNLLNKQEYIVSITYILSILAEKRFNLISEGLIKKSGSFLHSPNVKLKLNSLIIIGFAMLANSKYIDEYSQDFLKLLFEDSDDIRNNIHYFLLKLVDIKPNLAKGNVDIILKSLIKEKNKNNIISILNLLDYCDEFEFDQLYLFRDISKSLITLFEDKKTSKIYIKLIILIKKFFPQLNQLDLEPLDTKRIIELLDNQFIMKRHNFTRLSKNKDLKLKDYLKNFMKSDIKDKKIYFYATTKENIVFIYELEKSKLNRFFNVKIKISDKKIHETFSSVIDNDSEQKIFVKTLNNLKIIDGYYSNIGFFYPFDYFKLKFLDNLHNSGSINLKNFNFLPQKFIDKVINYISKSTNQIFLRDKDQEIYTSLKYIKDRINSEAAKKSIIELKLYRDILLEEDFIKLIKNMPREYLSEFHKGTQWLTNLGVQKITYEVQNSKIVGYFNISKISRKLNISDLLLLDVFDLLIDYRSGIWDKNKNIFYYSKYLNDKINEISVISDETEKFKQIEMISNEFDIDKNHILSKIDENLHLIAEEIKQKDKIKISEYVEKTGMEVNVFLKFINDLGISYFKKADLLIFNPLKIEEAKNDIKYMLIDKSKSVDFINLGTMMSSSSIVEDLIKDLLVDGKLKGIFHETEGQVVFYTERGIINLMLENSVLFSFHDLFFEKDLNQAEIDLLRDVFDDLVKSKKLRGNFNEETLTFSSDEVIFAKDYNIVLFEFEKMVGNYIKKFETEFQKIQKILTKEGETIFPQEIKIIQETLDKINVKYVNWRSGLEAFIRRTNKKLLKDQGINVKQYKKLFLKEKKEEIKSLEDDPEVHEILNDFNRWIKLFNKLELKYPNVLFYQKRLVNNPNNKESREKYIELLEELDLK